MTNVTTQRIKSPVKEEQKNVQPAEVSISPVKADETPNEVIDDMDKGKKAEDQDTVEDYEFAAKVGEDSKIECPHCKKAFKVEKDEPTKADGEEPELEDKKEDAPAASKVDPYAKGKLLKKADTSKYFKNELFVSEKDKAFADKLLNSFKTGHKEGDSIIEEHIKTLNN